MLKNDTLKNGTSPAGLYGSAPPYRGWNRSHLVPVEFKSGSPDVKHTIYEMHLNFLIVILHFTDPGFSLKLCCPLKISEKEKIKNNRSNKPMFKNNGHCLLPFWQKTRILCKEAY